MDLQLTANQQRLQHRCRELAADFATRSAAHDHDAGHPIENYERLREEGFLALTVGKGRSAYSVDRSSTFGLLLLPGVGYATAPLVGRFVDRRRLRIAILTIS